MLACPVAGCMSGRTSVGRALSWRREILDEKGVHVIIDGKALRGGTERRRGGNTPYVLNAMDAATQLVIGQLAIDTIENNLHHVLDDAFREDRPPASKSKNNLALIRKIACNIFRGILKYQGGEHAMMMMTFVFDNNKLQQVGKTADEVIAPMRDHAKKWHIDEVAPYQFQKDGKDAMCDLFMFIPEILEKDSDYYKYFSYWYVEEDGRFKEDCIEGSKDALETRMLHRGW